jgi:hypothetical protein
MRGAVHSAKSTKEIATIRGLQMDASWLASVRADAEWRAVEQQLDEGCATMRAAELGWAAAMDGMAFDPALSRFWFCLLETRREEVRMLGEAAMQAEQEASRRRRAYQEAQARSEASQAQARSAARTAARRRDENRLAAVEDQLNARWRTS